MGGAAHMRMRAVAVEIWDGMANSMASGAMGNRFDSFSH